MKKAILSVLMALVMLAVYASDFKLIDGSLIIGELKGINSGNMYIVDTSEQLHIVSMDQIKEINNGSGDVASIWKRRKPFMDIDPGKYQGPNLVQIVSDQKPNLLAPPPNMPSVEASLASINRLMWMQFHIAVVTVAVAVIAITVVTLTK